MDPRALMMEIRKSVMGMMGLITSRYYFRVFPQKHMLGREAGEKETEDRRTEWCGERAGYGSDMNGRKRQPETQI
jgi:hypothetical protein